MLLFLSDGDLPATEIAAGLHTTQETSTYDLFTAFVPINNQINRIDTIPGKPITLYGKIRDESDTSYNSGKIIFLPNNKNIGNIIAPIGKNGLYEVEIKPGEYLVQIYGYNKDGSVKAFYTEGAIISEEGEYESIKAPEDK